MNIIIILFLISGIINILYINKLKMYTAKKLYSFTLFIMLLLFSFISDSLIIRFIIKLFTPFSVYKFVSSALNNNDYVFTFLLIVSIVIIINIIVLISFNQYFPIILLFIIYSKLCLYL